MTNIELINFNPDDIVKEINKKGYCELSLSINDEFEKSIEKISSSNFQINENTISGKFSDNQFFFLDLLCTSKPFVNLLINNKIKKLLNIFFDNKK